MTTKDNIIKSYNIEAIKAVEGLENDFAIFPFDYFMKDNERLKSSHRHNFYSLIYTTQGAGSHSIDFNEYSIKPQRVFFINIGQIHAWNKLNHVKGYVLLFSEQFYNIVYTGNDYLKSDIALQNLSPYIDLTKKENTDWQLLFEQILAEHNKPLKFNKEIACMLLKVMILNYTRKQDKLNTSNNKVNRKLQQANTYKQLVNKFYLEKKSPKEFASIMNITPNYLNGICHQYLGKTAGEIIKERVVLEAKRLLSHTALSVTEVAYQLGFEDKSHFGKYFKLSTKSTPNNFKKKFMNLKIHNHELQNQ